MGILSKFIRGDSESDGGGSPTLDATGTAAPQAESRTVRDDEAGWNTSALTEPPHPKPGAAAFGPADPLKTLQLKPKVIEAIQTVFDPEIPVNIYELGLIYDVVIDAEARVSIAMTLTSPACPSAQQLPSEVQFKVKALEGVSDARVEVVWEPPWSPDKMSDAARLQLGLW